MDSALSTVRLVAEELVERGASAVVLAGSHARGDAGPESDLDDIVVGLEDFSCSLERREGFLVSVSERPFEKHCEAFEDPGSVCSAVPGWREALAVYDPDGLAASLLADRRSSGLDLGTAGAAARRVGGRSGDGIRRGGSQARRGAP